jgi:hypothetical protein
MTHDMNRHELMTMNDASDMTDNKTETQ